MKDFFRFCVAMGKSKIVNKIICDSFNAVAEWFFASFICVINTQINKNDRSEVYNISIFRISQKKDNIILYIFERFERRA